VRRAAVANLGIRPTFDEDRPLLEVHLLDYDGDLYGSELRVEFVKRLRAIVRFEHHKDLIAQVRRDIARAREILQASTVAEASR
jgi:riboflavin kinase/FMN adenylyltransferase